MLAGWGLFAAHAAGWVDCYKMHGGLATPGSALMASPVEKSQRAAAPPVTLPSPQAAPLSVLSPTSSGPLSPGLWSPPQKQRPRSCALPVSPQLPAWATGKTLGAFNRRTVGRTVWLFYCRAAAELPSRGGALSSDPHTITVGKLGLMVTDGIAFIEQIEVYQQHRGRQVSQAHSGLLQFIVLERV